jgi:hypothetical protein
LGDSRSSCVVRRASEMARPTTTWRNVHSSLEFDEGAGLATGAGRAGVYAAREDTQPRDKASERNATAARPKRFMAGRVSMPSAVWNQLLCRRGR